MSTTLKHRTAINPLPWILGDGGYRLDRSVLQEAMTALSQVGFTPAEYRALLAEHSLAPAPGYFSAPFHDRPPCLPSGDSPPSPLPISATFIPGRARRAARGRSRRR